MATEQPRAVWCCSTCGAIYHKDFPRCPADGGEVLMAARDPLLGTVIGHYRIQRLIGEGGMGRVYLADHANLPNKRYAVKVLLGDHAASAMMRARFIREAERASQLDHPNVASVVDFGQTGHGLLYIVMDYVDGPSLVALIGELPMAPARVIALTREICKGLVYAHAAGLVHRDLKPENILVASGPGGEVPRIVDFGLAMSIDQSDPRLTESGMTMGTPAFAAPEQLSGKPIDHRADLYALGMTMFEMLTGGMMPVDGHMMEVMAARTAQDAPRISERAPGLGVPPALDDLVARLTRRKPAERFASAGEVIEALDAVVVEPAGRANAPPVVEPAAAPEIEPAIEPVAAPAGADPTDPDAKPRREVPAGRSLELADPLDGRSTERTRRSRTGPVAVLLVAACGVLAILWLASARWRGGSRATAASAHPGSGLAATPAVAPSSAPAAPVAVARTEPPAAPGAPGPPAPPAQIDEASGPAHAAPADPDAVSSAPDAVAGEDASRRPGTKPRSVATTGPHATGRKTARRPPARAGQASDDITITEDHVEARPPPEPAPPPAPPAPPPPAPVPRELQAVLDKVDVTGSLSTREVQRAIQRRWQAVQRCVPAGPEAVVARFTIGEARRATDIHASGAAAPTNACVAAAFADVRTEAAPDVGDVEVTVHITFSVKT